MQTYTQSKLKRGDEEQTAWIPTEFAVVNGVIQIRMEDSHWEDNWVVVETYSTREKGFVEEHERDYKKQRRASDI